MKYVSHQDYKNMMEKFKKQTSKGKLLKENVEEGNAFTRALANTKKGGKFKVGGKQMRDTSNYDNPSVKESDSGLDKILQAMAERFKNQKIDYETIEKIVDGLAKQGHEVNARYIQQFLSQHGVEINEYSYTDNYPGSWGYKENKEAESKVEVVKSWSDREYEIKRPDGKIVDVYFNDVHVEEKIDDYSAEGWISGEDNDGNEYKMSAGLVDMGGGGWDIDPHYSTIEFHPAESNTVTEDDYTDAPDEQSGDTDAMNIGESHFGNDQWYETFQATIDRMNITPDVRKHVMSALDNIDPIDEYGEMRADEAAREFVKDVKNHNLKKEGLHTPPLQATGPTIDTVEEDYMEKPFKVPMRKDTAMLDYDPDASRFEPDYMKTPGEVGDDDDDEDYDDNDLELGDDDDTPTNVSMHFKKALAGDRNRYPFLRENSTANPPMGFSVLSPDEKNQLTQYIESYKTIKNEIKKLLGKAGKTEGLGGNRTGLKMPISEGMDPEKYKEVEDKLGSKLHTALETVTGKIVKKLKAEGVEDDIIGMFLKYEMEEKAKEAQSSMHDL